MRNTPRPLCWTANFWSSEEGPDGSNSAELYNPLTETWSLTGQPVAPRYEHTTTRLLDGRVLVAGWGAMRGLSLPTDDSAELYDPATGAFSATGGLHTMRNGHTATLLHDGRVLVAGG